jgi:hypothetical protein
MNKGLVLMTVLVVAFFLTGCTDTKVTGKTFVGGSEGLKASFLPGTPPATTTDGGSGGFSIVVKMENAGENTIKANDGYIQIWGADARAFNSNIPDFKKKFSDQQGFGNDLRGTRMNSGSVLNGGIATVEFGQLSYQRVIQGDLPQKIWANICYKYTTQVAAQVCVKNNVEQALSNDDICQVEGEKNPQNSGAPIQVTSLRESYAGDGKIGLTLTLDHVGSGDNFFKDNSLECNNVPSNVDAGKVKVTFENVEISGKSVPVECQGTDTDGYVRLYSEGTGKETYTLYCTVDVSGSDNVVEVPIALELNYLYLQHITSDMTIRHVTK